MPKKFDLNEQCFEIRNYFETICDEDAFGLNINSFYNKVVNSIIKNGIDLTCSCYDLDKNILIKIVINGEKQ